MAGEDSASATSPGGVASLRSRFEALSSGTATAAAPLGPRQPTTQQPSPAMAIGVPGSSTRSRPPKIISQPSASSLLPPSKHGVSPSGGSACSSQSGFAWQAGRSPTSVSSSYTSPPPPPSRPMGPRSPSSIGTSPTSLSSYAGAPAPPPRPPGPIRDASTASLGTVAAVLAWAEGGQSPVATKKPSPLPSPTSAALSTPPSTGSGSRTPLYEQLHRVPAPPIPSRPTVTGTVGSAPTSYMHAPISAAPAPPLPTRPAAVSSVSAHASLAHAQPPPPPPQRILRPPVHAPTAPIPASAPAASTSYLPPHFAPRRAASPDLLPAPPHSGALLPPPTRSAHPVSAPITPASHSANDNDSGSSDGGSDHGPSTPTTLGAALLPPDASRTNRRPPLIAELSTSLKAHSSATLAAQRGRTLVTAHGERLRIFRAGVPEGRTGLEVGATIVALCFAPPPPSARAKDPEAEEEGERFVWVATKECNVILVDCVEARFIGPRVNTYGEPLRWMRRCGDGIIAVDEGGKISVWSSPASLEAHPATQRISLSKGCTVLLIANQLWVSAGGNATSKEAKGAAPKIRIFNPLADLSEAHQTFNATSKPVTIPPGLAVGVGPVTAGTILPERPENVYLAHDSGHISIWSRATYTCTSVQRLGPSGITSLLGVMTRLWAGFRNGTIAVYDVDSAPWLMLKRWPAHTESITSLLVDPGSLPLGHLGVLSTSASGVKLWDGKLKRDWIDTRLADPEKEKRYANFKELRLLQITYNIDSASPTDFGTADSINWLQNVLTSSKDKTPDIIVFGFQEVVDLDSRKVTAKTLLLGKRAKAAPELADRISSQYNAWKAALVKAVRNAMPPDAPFVLLGDKPVYLVGLFQCVFVRGEVMKKVRDLAVADVKTGFQGRMGNKGATITRFVYSDTSIAFANCHLAAGQSKKKARNKDIADILEAEPFDGVLSDAAAFTAGGAGEMLTDHELLFVSGDLNYRIDGTSRSSAIAHVDSGRLAPLLTHDQLIREMRSNPACRLRSFMEAPITFNPTYKYDRGSHAWDTSSKARSPAWCDRILWLARAGERVKCLEYRAWFEPTVSDHRPVSAIFDIQVRRVDAEKKRALEIELELEWDSIEAEILLRASQHYSIYA